MKYELYALRYGRQPDLTVQDSVLFRNRETMRGPKQPFEYFFWLARSGADIVMIDCGFSKEQGLRRGRETLSPIPALLDELGVRPEQVGDLVLTHLHYDHTGNLDLFPQARLHIHAAEWAWAAGPAMSDPTLAKYYDSNDVAAVLKRLYRDQVRLIDQDHAVVKGLDIVRIGGHCPGQMIVTVPTCAAEVVLASDASHLDRNWVERNPFPILHEMQEVMHGYDILARKAAAGAEIVAGHDPSIFWNYKVVGTSGHIVALHQPVEFTRPDMGLSLQL